MVCIKDQSKQIIKKKQTRKAHSYCLNTQKVINMLAVVCIDLCANIASSFLFENRQQQNNKKPSRSFSSQIVNHLFIAQCRVLLRWILIETKEKVNANPRCQDLAPKLLKSALFSKSALSREAPKYARVWTAKQLNICSIRIYCVC